MNKDTIKRLINSLPESPNIMGKDRYFNSAVLVPVVTIDNELHLLFEKRADSIRQGSEICFPGGKFDPLTDSSLKETAIRETIEELGIHKDAINVLGQFDTLVASIGATVDSYLAEIEISNLDELNINGGEVEKVFTLPVSFFLENPVETYQVRLIVEPSYINKKGEEVVLLPGKQLGLPEIYHGPWGGTRHRVLVYKTDEGPLWGITAEIVNDLVEKITHPS